MSGAIGIVATGKLARALRTVLRAVRKARQASGASRVVFYRAHTGAPWAAFRPFEGPNPGKDRPKGPKTRNRAVSGRSRGLPEASVRGPGDPQAPVRGVQGDRG